MFKGGVLSVQEPLFGFQLYTLFINFFLSWQVTYSSRRAFNGYLLMWIPITLKNFLDLADLVHGLIAVR